MTSPKQIVFIEGNLASGKTTALSFLKSQSTDRYILLEEPVNHWQNIPTNRGPPLNLLDDFYQDLPKYSFCFQTYAFLSRMKLLLQALQELQANPDQTTIVCERSIFTDREIFLESLVEAKHVTPTEQTIYHHLWDFWISLMQPYFKDVKIKFLYLECSPEKALAHKLARARSEEAGVDLTYLTALDQKHRQVYLENQERLKELVKVLTNNNQITVETLTNDGQKEAYHQKLTEYFNLN